MNGLKRQRNRQDTPVFLAVLGLIVAALVTVLHTPGQMDLTDSLIGVMLLLVCSSYTRDVPDRLSARAAFAMVRGAALWFVLAGLLYAARHAPLTQPYIEPLCWELSVYLPERYWLPAGWALLSLFALMFGGGTKGGQST